MPLVSKGSFIEQVEDKSTGPRLPGKRLADFIQCLMKTTATVMRPSYIKDINVENKTTDLTKYAATSSQTQNRNESNYRMFSKEC